MVIMNIIRNGERVMDGKISNLAQVASLRRYTVTSGKEQGLDIIDCDNGKLRFLLNVSKACDVMQLYDKGQNMSFISKNGFMKRELPFAKRFEGGMLYTCGLDSVGEREGFEEHGSLHNTPVQILRAECDDTQIVVESLLSDTEVFGKNLVLRRTITSRTGSDSVSVIDRLTNCGYRDENYCLLYHVNLGYPLIDDGARIVAETLSCQPRTQWAEKNIDTAFELSEAVPEMEETCYYLTVKKPEVSLVNEKIGKKFTVSYSADTLPNFLVWKSLASGDYAVGLEPCTTKLDHLFEYSTLKAGETLEFRVELSVKDLPSR
ncbi:MAG: DUF4432 family protein [Ruminococcaceae bacterium]|nr:DUF4432 family protein [Oscillospiraceae bacterium]